MKVSIFGSCRQQPLLSHYIGTSIQEALTYPHYTKEIIQAIEFCKGMPISSLTTQHCFRTGILENRPITNQAGLQKEYEESNVIVVEIASRISYEWNHVYMHHIATEEQYGFHDLSQIHVGQSPPRDRHAIVQRDLTDEEIEADIWRIKQLVQGESSPKKLLIASHIYTKEQGKRYELIKLVERLCLKYDIAFLSPSEYLAHESGVYQEEPILAHYTDKGKEIIGHVYKDAIENLFKPYTVVLVVKQQYENVPQTSTSNFWGIGDMIRSIYGMYKKSKYSNFKLRIDLSRHPIAPFLIHSTTTLPVDLHTIPFIVNDGIDAYIQSTLSTQNTVYMGAHCNLQAYDPCEHDTLIKILMKRHIRPNHVFTSFINEHMQCIQSISNATVLHYRLGDSELVNGIIDTNKLDTYYSHLVTHMTEHSILLTDSSAFKSFVKEKGCMIAMFDHVIGHTGYDSSYDKIKHSLFEFFIISKVKQIKTYSIYEWISGFVYSIHKLFDIPLASIR